MSSILICFRFEVLSIEDSFQTESAVGFQKDSELLELFNYHFARMKESGILAKTLSPIFTRASKMEATVNGQMAQPSADELGLSYTTVSFPFIVLSIGIVSTMILSVYERFIFLWKIT